MREAELRDRFARRWSMAYVPQELWVLLRQDIERTLRELAEADDQEDEEYLLDEFLKLANSHFRAYEAGARSARAGTGRRGSSRGRNEEEPGTGDQSHVPGVLTSPAIRAQDFLDEHERSRASATASALAILAARMPQVQRFRRNVLGRDALTPTEAEAFVVSPAARFLTPAHFARLGIPVLAHQARVVGWSADWIPVPRDEDLDADSTVVHRELRDDRPWHYECRVRVQFDSPTLPEAVVETRIVVMEPEHVLHAPFHPQAAIDDWKGGDPFPVIFHNSLIDRLRAWSMVLAHQFPWSVSEAAWFILTSNYPQVLPLRLGSRAHHTIIAADGFNTARAKPQGETVITAEPWVSSKAVKAIYRAVQQKRLRRDTRPLPNRNLEVFTFVLENWPQGSSEPNWNDLRLLWNDHCQSYTPVAESWTYKEDWRFKRDFERAESKLVPGAGEIVSHGPMANPIWYEV